MRDKFKGCNGGRRRMNGRFPEEKIKEMNMKNTCKYCASTKGLHRISFLTQPKENEYYCDQHVQDAKSFNAVRKTAFLEFYSIEDHRNDLPKSLLCLYHEWSNEPHQIEQNIAAQEQLELRVTQFEEKWQVVKAQKRLQRIQAEKERNAIQKETSKNIFQKLFKTKK
jgi:secreted PhoX family phosphatase